MRVNIIQLVNHVLIPTMRMGLSLFEYCNNLVYNVITDTNIITSLLFGGNSMELDFNNPIPLHAQLKIILEDQIVQGYYKDKIPSERELMDMYSVSRSTVREAVSILVREGILEKRHGKGTFVSLKPVQEWLKMISFTETTKNMAIKLLNHGRVNTPENISDANGFGKESYHIKRLRLDRKSVV